MRERVRASGLTQATEDQIEGLGFGVQGLGFGVGGL